ncbi:MAG: glycosyltransferase [Eubacteriales bacterium]|nr:glycosyltransferase [Eubacteriales bacterium]
MTKNSKPDVSIIVPIYNAEKTISRLIESILEQEYKNFELILANDGSKDNTLDICRGYAKKDERIVILDKENTGVSDTRNQAIAMARGEYLQFADSDDWLTPDATSSFILSAKATGCDMVIADFYRVIGDRVSRKGSIKETQVMSREAFASNMMERPADFYYGVLWNKLYKRSIIEKYGLKMNPEISWCEDFMFNLEYIRHAESFIALQVPVYYYVKTEQSLSSQDLSVTKTISMKRMVFEYYHNFYKNVFDEETYDKKKPYIYRFLLDFARDGMIPPAIISDSTKLGEERISVYSDYILGNDMLSEVYRTRKLTEVVLEQEALRREMSLEEMEVLYYLYCHYKGGKLSKKSLGEFFGLSRNKISKSLNKLVQKGYIKLDDKSGIIFQNSFNELKEAFKRAELRLDSLIFDGLSEEEMQLAEVIIEKLKRNVINALKTRDEIRPEDPENTEKYSV